MWKCVQSTVRTVQSVVLTNSHHSNVCIMHVPSTTHWSSSSGSGVMRRNYGSISVGHVNHVGYNNAGSYHHHHNGMVAGRGIISAAATRSTHRSAAMSTKPTNKTGSSSSPASYKEVLQQLLLINRDRKVKLGIENTRELAQLLNLTFPYPIIHVAGTNGKGSVCLKLARALRAFGLRVGLYTSPHISSFRERIVVNESVISEEEVVNVGTPILDLCRQSNIPATFFELTTLIAFTHFRNHQIDVAVVEVGLGGRGDSTNIITPCLSIITSIGLEHTAILGDTIEKIASEKAGIIKPSVPVIVGHTVPRTVIDQVAHSCGSEVVYQPSPSLSSSSSSISDYDQQNQQLVRIALDKLSLPNMLSLSARSHQPTPHQINAALNTRPSCRMEEIEVKHVRHNGTTATVRCILDVAHNPQAFESLFTAIRLRYGHPIIRCVIGLSREKDASTILRTVFLNSNYVHIVAADSHRAKPILEISHLVREQHLLA